MTELELLQFDLYRIARYGIETPKYLEYNQLLWSNIQGLSEDAIKEAIKQLEYASNPV